MTDAVTPTTPEDPDDPSRMPLRDHLEELRSTLLRSFVALVILFAGGMALKDRLIRFVLVPWDRARESILLGGGQDPGVLSMIKPQEAFVFSLKVALAFALVVGAPYYLRLLWSFVVAGLMPNEKRAFWKAFPVSVVLFLGGMAFGYLILVPVGLDFLLTSVSPELIDPQVTVSEYFSLLLALTLLMGGVFLLPLFMWAGVRTGLVELETLSGSRRIAVVLMLIFASIMTPPDVVTQLLVAGPMMLLYEVGLMLARAASRARNREVSRGA